jgi:hypothetical protein
LFLLPFGSFLSRWLQSCLWRVRSFVSTPFWEFQTGSRAQALQNVQLFLLPFGSFGIAYVSVLSVLFNPISFYSLLGVSEQLKKVAENTWSDKIVSTPFWEFLLKALSVYS